MDRSIDSIVKEREAETECGHVSAEIVSGDPPL
jgi:hypothetical protein